MFEFGIFKDINCYFDGYNQLFNCCQSDDIVNNFMFSFYMFENL